MIQIAVVEDDALFLEQIRENLKRYEKERGETFSIHTYTDGDEILENYTTDFQLILMDIEMTFVDGITAAQEIRKRDTQVEIVFLTNSPQYAMKGYKVAALDYILKPITYFAFSTMMDSALRRIRGKTERYITVNIKGGLQKIRVGAITYVEVSDHDLIFHTIDGNIQVKSTMRSVEQALEKEPFFRCNKCFLVNLNYVERVQGSDLQVGSDVLLVSRSRKKELMEALNHFMNEVEG